MFRSDKWPFTPTKLTDIIANETLAVIEAGCCERLQRAMTIIDADRRQTAISRIDSINERQRFEDFCACLRDEERVRGGNEACEQCDIGQAKVSLKRSKNEDYRTFRCHMGLWDATHVVRIRDQPVAILFSGQCRPPEGTERIEQNVEALGRGRYAHIEFIDETAREELLWRVDQLREALPDFDQRMRREADHIRQIAEAEFRRIKNNWEQAFLDRLRSFANCSQVNSLNQLGQCTTQLLTRIRTFCRSEYVIFFGSTGEGDTVLAPIAEVGIPGQIGSQRPHFNWKKAGLPLDSSETRAWDICHGLEPAMKGIRGDNSGFFAKASCILPTSLGNWYRGVLVLGPFAEEVVLDDERHFLKEIADIIGAIVLTGLQVLYLERERRRWQSTAKLLTHQLRTTLTPITTRLGNARLLAQTFNMNTTASRIVGSLQRAEDLCLRLGKSAQETLNGYVLLLEPEDLDFERYPLSVLVANCVQGFMSEAEKRHRDLVLDKSVELLYESEVDVTRLTIALSNLVDNAIKYSYPETTIDVRSGVHSPGDLELATAVIEVDDLGDPVRPEDMEIIFEQGTRALTRAKMGRIPGTGLGLWEARAVVEAHGGSITVSSKPTSIYRPQGQAFHTIFSIRIPLRPSR